MVGEVKVGLRSLIPKRVDTIQKICLIYLIERFQ